MKPTVPLSFISNDAFREIFQSLSEGILMVNESGVIITANPVAEEMFGYPENKLNTMSLENLLPIRYRGGHVGMRKSFILNPGEWESGVI